MPTAWLVHKAHGQCISAQTAGTRCTDDKLMCMKGAVGGALISSSNVMDREIDFGARLSAELDQKTESTLFWFFMQAV